MGVAWHGRCGMGDDALSLSMEDWVGYWVGLGGAQ